MKTLQDLVDELNKSSEPAMLFYISDVFLELPTIICCLYGYYWELVRFDEDDEVHILPEFNNMSNDIKEPILSYLIKHRPQDWFEEEKRYKVIISQSISSSYEETYTVLCKEYKDGYFKFKTILLSESELTNKPEYVFTETQIEDVKSYLPENMRKIIDLGKVEVKDD